MCKHLNGANAYMLSHVTGKTKHEEAKPETTTFNIVAWIRARRLKWVGHILRLKDEDNRQIKDTLRVIFKIGRTEIFSWTYRKKAGTNLFLQQRIK